MPKSILLTFSWRVSLRLIFYHSFKRFPRFLSSSNIFSSLYDFLFLTSGLPLDSGCSPHACCLLAFRDFFHLLTCRSNPKLSRDSSLSRPDLTFRPWTLEDYFYYLWNAQRKDYETKESYGYILILHFIFGHHH
jgi:hypothetical protein